MTTKAILIICTLCTLLGGVLGWFVHNPEIKEVVVTGAVKTDTVTIKEIVGTKVPYAVYKTLTEIETLKVPTWQDTVYFHTDEVPIVAVITPDTEKADQYPVDINAHFDTKYYRGRLLNTKIYIDPIIFKYKEAKTIVNEYRGYPLFGIRSILGMGSNSGIGAMAEFDRFGFGMYVPFKASPTFMMSVGIPIFE